VSEKKKILVVFPVVPYPLRENGTSIRYLPFLRRLNIDYELDIIVIDDISRDSISGLGEYCNNYFVVEKPRKSKYWLLESLLLYFLWVFPWTPPHSSQYYGSRQTINSIANSSNRKYDLIIWVTSTYLSMLPPIRSRLGIKKVLIDFIDSPSLIMERRMKQLCSRGFLDRYELWKMRKWEKSIAKTADSVVYISAVDAGATGGNNELNHAHVIPNGVDASDYTDKCGLNYGDMTIGYLGNMSYEPNVTAVRWLYNNLLCKIGDNTVKLVVIGKDADQQILSLADDPRVILTGTVDSIWPYINSVDIFVLPIFTGAGLKNKVLEIMYAGGPLVTTTIGNEGIDAEPGTQLFICQNEQEFIVRINQLLEDKELRKRMGQEAREFVNRNFNSESIVKAYMAMIESCLN